MAKTILHIEDDEDNRLLVRKLLSTHGHVVVDAESGLEGVKLAKELNPDLVLVDIQIPDLDGYEVILRLRSLEALTETPIVGITAEGNRHAVLAVGAQGLIEKPIVATQFSETVLRFLEGYQDPPSSSGQEHLQRVAHRMVERLERTIGELSEANDRLEAMARLRREFLRNVSHELATPMTPVVGYLKLLIDEELGPLTPLQRKCIESIRNSTRRLRSVTDTLLDVSSLETDRMHFYARDYDFGNIAERALEEARPRFEESGVSLDLGDGYGEERGPMPGKGDPEKLRRAMVHLLDNAAKFTPREGRVQVLLQSQGSNTNTMYSLTVTDSGPGISPDQFDQIFEPFYQADGSVTRAHGGVGLGLAFARRVSQAMGGNVTLESPPQPQASLRDDANGPRSGTRVLLSVAARPTTAEVGNQGSRDPIA